MDVLRSVVRDMKKTGDSQIYHWGIKEDAPLGGEGGGESASRNDASSDAFSKNIMSQRLESVKPYNGISHVYTALLKKLAAERIARKRIAIGAKPRYNR